MAEVVGAIASGISITTLAVQIATSVAKLKSYWDQLNEAPEDIRLLMEEIEDLNALFSDIEEDQCRNPISSTILDSTKCLEHCRRGANYLKQLTDDLSTDFHSRSKPKSKWASVKVVLRKDKIELYKSRLERAIRILTLSHDCYTRALIRSQPDIIVSQISAITNAPQITKAAATSTLVSATVASSIQLCQPVGQRQELQSNPSPSNIARLYQKKQRGQHRNLTTRYRRRVCLVNWMWDFEVLKSRSGWTINLRTCHIVPFESRFMQLMRKLDLRGIEELFDQGQASTSVVTIDGMSILEYAFVLCDPSICRLLLERGAEWNTSSNTPIHLINYLTARKIPLERWHELVRLSFSIPKYQFRTSDLQYFRGPTEAFLILQCYVEGAYYDTPFETRLEIANGIAADAPYNTSALFRIALCPGPVPSNAVNYKTKTGKTLLHCVADAIRNTVSHIELHANNRSEFTDDLQGSIAKPFSCSITHEKALLGWREILRELVIMGGDLCAIWVDHWTPFLCLFFIVESHLPCDPHIINRISSIWLEDLHTSGVNLLDYGQKEKAIWTRYPYGRNYFYFNSELEYQYNCSLIGFTYGASPSDWRIWISEPTDHFAAEFWSMIEAPEEMMPGSWVE